MRFLAIAIATLCFISAAVSYAARAPDYTIHQEYTSTRALGMGNAFTAVADDHSALFYNPAALAYRTDSQLRLFLRGGLDAEVLEFQDDVEKAGDDETEIANVIAKHYGDHLYVRIPTLGAILVRPKWGMAIIPADLSTDFSFHRSAGPSVFVNSYLDTTIAYGRGQLWNAPLIRNKIAFGWTAKVLHRVFYSDVIQSAQLANDEDLVNMDRAAEGATLDGDIGFMIPSRRGKDKWYRPTWGLVVRNVFDYGFPKNFGIFNDDPDEPPKLERRVDVGAKWDLPQFWVFDPKLAVDVRDMGHRNWTPMKGFHAGMEAYWKMRNWWKGHWSAGINQGYWTAGFGARLGIFQLDLASWGEEVGTTDTRRESRRYIAEMSLDF